MLLRFGVKNYRSINERQELSMIATSLKDQDEGLIDKPEAFNRRLLPAAIVYGANASGKSNLISALHWMRTAVLDSHRKGDPKGGVSRREFALSKDALSKPTLCDMDFILDGVRYHYGFEATNEAYTGEWLYSFPEGSRRKLFERVSPRKVEFGGSFRGHKRVIEDLMRPNSLYLSAGTQNAHEDLSVVSSFFETLRFNDLISVAGGTISSQFSKGGVDIRTIEFLKKIGTGVIGYRIKDEDMPEEFKGMAKKFMSGISQMIEIDVDEKIDSEIEKYLKQYIEEEMGVVELAHQSSDGEKVYFDIDWESAGTRRLMLLLGNAFSALDTGCPFIIDELDASLHTQACEAVLALFSNPVTNPKGAQLIATTHDTNLMLSKMLRRDQIWFTEKDDGGATHLYPLSDIKTRQSDNIERGYLQGRYGAIPFAGSIADLFMAA